MGLKCPKCGSEDHGVVTSRPDDGAVRRRRACPCGERFTTLEEIVPRGATTRDELLARLKLARNRLRHLKNGDRHRNRGRARDEAAETGEPVEQIYQRWGVQ